MYINYMLLRCAIPSLKNGYWNFWYVLLLTAQIDPHPFCGKEDKYLDQVPGTALLSDLGIVHGHQVPTFISFFLFGRPSHKGSKVEILEAANLKRGSGKNSHIVLVPQPSDDPNDPSVSSYPFFKKILANVNIRLNWPRWRKEACFWTLYVDFDVGVSSNSSTYYQGLCRHSRWSTVPNGWTWLRSFVQSIWSERGRGGLFIRLDSTGLRMLHVTVPRFPSW